MNVWLILCRNFINWCPNSNPKLKVRAKTCSYFLMMNVAIVLLCLVCGCYAGGGKSIKDGFQTLGGELGDLSDRVEVLEKNEVEQAKLKTARWHLGMNINPADGHIFGYIVGKWHVDHHPMIRFFKRFKNLKSIDKSQELLNTFQAGRMVTILELTKKLWKQIFSALKSGKNRLIILPLFDIRVV